MYSYDIEQLRNILADVIQQNITGDAWSWLAKQGDINNVAGFNSAFALMPRKTGKALVTVSAAQQQKIKDIRAGLTLDNWTADRLCRVWLLIKPDATAEDSYFRIIETLFTATEMNEQVALYSALPVLPWARIWVKRCAEGIRSNIGTVLEAIMYHNAYPAENLSEAAWNQMVLKAFFTEKDVALIYGLDKRANKELSRILVDYAKERWAAGRTVDAMLWQIAGKFIDDGILSEMKQGHWEKAGAI